MPDTLSTTIMKSKTVPLWSLIVTLIVGLFGGGGAFWKWKASRLEEVHVSIETAKASLEIRSKMEQLLREIVAYMQDSGSRQKHILEFRAKIDAYNAAERQLANLEGRDPVRYDFEKMLPSAPFGVR